MKRRLALCYGTRPQVIKASALRRALGAHWNVVAVDTGQHYDYALNELLYRQLEVAPPDHFLEVGSGSHGGQTAAILVKMEQLLATARPDAAVVIGDTNSTLGCALAAAKCRIPVAHVEAGLRAHDRLMAEELNRRATDAIATLLCAPSESAAARLRAEHPDALVRLTGDIARDILEAQLAVLPEPADVHPAATAPYLFATIHRAEITNQPTLLRALLDAIGRLSCSTILAMHPRTRAALERHALLAGGTGRLHVIPPVGYRETLALARGAAAVLTDSGGVQREAYWLGVPCVTLRSETEWAETVACGANQLLAPADAVGGLYRVIDTLLTRPVPPWTRDAYGAGKAACAVTDAIREWSA